MSYKKLSKAGHSYGSETIFTNWEQSVAKITVNFLRFVIQSIAQMRAFISEWSGDWLALVFLPPIKPSTFQCVILPLSRIDFLIFHDPSVKHHLPGIYSTIASTSNRVWLIPCVSELCASAQSNDSFSANLRVSIGSISKLLKTLLFLPFNMYHRSKQIDDLQIPGKPSKRNDPYL